MNPDTVFVWNKVGELPVSAAYGVSVSCSDGIICIGGTDGQDALTSVYKIRWDEKSEKNGKNKKKGKVVIETLPALPYALDNMCGTLIGEQLFIAGGNRNGKPSNSFLRLDLTNLFSELAVL
jgi:sialate O-acetylesterase